MSVQVVMAMEEEEKRLAFRLRYNVMCDELRWLSPEDYPEQLECDEYDKHQSITFLAKDFLGRCIGTSRLILPGNIPLPIHGNFKTIPAKVLEAVHGTLEYCVEVSRFIVPENPFYKNHEITLRLCREMIKMSIKIGVTHAFLSIDHKFYRMLKILGFPITAIGKSKLYMGSVTTPGVLTLQDLLPQLKIKKPSLYDFMAAEGDMAMETSHV